eukprot:4535317-Pleurochrysis_carterae.AAC.2
MSLSVCDRALPQRQREYTANETNARVRPRAELRAEIQLRPIDRVSANCSSCLFRSVLARKQLSHLWLTTSSIDRLLPQRFAYVRRRCTCVGTTHLAKVSEAHDAQGVVEPLHAQHGRAHAVALADKLAPGCLNCPLVPGNTQQPQAKNQAAEQKDGPRDDEGNGQPEALKATVISRGEFRTPKATAQQAGILKEIRTSSTGQLRSLPPAVAEKQRIVT